jgi:serine/threonine protein phosphatase PrpC
MPDFTNYIADSVQGLTHAENQDGFLAIVEKEYILFFVFDGVSRSQHPKQGIELAIEFITDGHSRFYRKDAFDMQGLMYMVQKHILQSKYENALTTYCAVTLLKKDMKVVSVSNLGDSRVYLFDNHSGFRPVSDDDTLFPGSNILTRCLGMEGLDRNDFREEKISRTGRNLLLCSDGFYHLFSDDTLKLKEIFKDTDISNLKNLIKQKIEGNNFDDATYLYAVLKDD